MSNKLILILLISLASMTNWSCVPETGKQDMRMVRREMLGREPIKASPSAIISQMNFLGEEAIHLTDSLWSKKLKATKEPSCRPAFKQVADSVDYWYQGQMQQYAFGSNGKPTDAKTVEILEAYKYSFKQMQAIAANVQKLNEKELLFTKPLVLNKEICRRCHQSGSDTLGLWLFKLPKKEVILSIGDR